MADGKTILRAWLKGDQWIHAVSRDRQLATVCGIAIGPADHIEQRSFDTSAQAIGTCSRCTANLKGRF